MSNAHFPFILQHKFLLLVTWPPLVQLFWPVVVVVLQAGTSSQRMNHWNAEECVEDRVGGPTKTSSTYRIECQFSTGWPNATMGQPGCESHCAGNPLVISHSVPCLQVLWRPTYLPTTFHSPHIRLTCSSKLFLGVNVMCGWWFVPMCVALLWIGNLSRLVTPSSPWDTWPQQQETENGSMYSGCTH